MDEKRGGMGGRRGGSRSPIKVEGLRKRRRHDWGRCADDAEVIPPEADVATGFTPGRIARTDRTQGHNRGINPLATWKCGRRGGRPSR